MTRKELYQAFCQRIPAALSAEWDNDGMQVCADAARTVRRILCVLDVTDDAVLYAEQNGFDLILSHHPLIFRPLSALTEEEPVSARVLRLLRSDIAHFAFHTRLDAVLGGVNDTLCRLLALQHTAPLGEGEASLGRVGDLPSPMPLSDFAALVKRVLDAPVLQISAKTQTVSRVAVVGGEGKDFIGDAAKTADTYLSGRLGYHAMLDAPINLIEAGHYYTERPIAQMLSCMAKDICPEAVTEIYTPTPFQFYQ